MTQFKLFARSAKNKSSDVTSSRILVCGLCGGFDEASADAQVYIRFFPNTLVSRLISIQQLSGLISEGYDVVHLHCALSGDGSLVDSEGAILSGTELISQACASSVKVLFIASDNPSDAYIKGFKAPGKPINLVMTLNRNKGFLIFLASLLERMKKGATMPVAWASVTSPKSSLEPESMPSCIFFAGRPEFTLCP